MRGVYEAFKVIGHEAVEGSATKPVAGHRCAGAVVIVRVKCECGWESGGHLGKGARRDAYAVWRLHVLECAEAR
jgi:hypothetical protein